MREQPYHIDQCLFVRPEFRFEELDRALRGRGWLRDPTTAATSPRVAGEVELAGWIRPGGHPRILYTCNPVAMLRVLDVATLGPLERASLASAVPVMGPDERVAHYHSGDPRTRLRGVLAAREAQDLDHIPALESLYDDPEPAVAAAAREATAVLRRVLHARESAGALLAPICEVADTLLEALAGPDGSQLSAALQPQPDDYAAVVHPRVAGDVARHYVELWKASPRVPTGPAAHGFDVQACPAGMFRTHNPYSASFPRGYRDVAGWLRPERVWVCWRTKGSRAAYDGLVWLDDHWAWFPNPWRPIGAAVSLQATTVH